MPSSGDERRLKHTVRENQAAIWPVLHPETTKSKPEPKVCRALNVCPALLP